QLLRENFDDLTATGVRLRRVQRVSTGGSTGEPVTLLVDMSMGFAIALRHRAHRWFGLEPGAREIVLWGSPIEVTRQDRLRNVRDWLINSKLISAFDLGAPALAEYARIITRHRPLRIYGYASAIYLLACFLEREGWRPDWRLHAVFTTAETLFDFQRKTIEAVFGCPVAVEYGARDAGNMANECPHGGLHIPAEGVVLETDAVAPDGLGEILATNCHRPAMPLIRYRTGDLGELTDERCRCGRSLPLLKRVEGRRTDFVVAPDGRIVHALALIYVLREMARVREFQIVQEDVDTVVVTLVARRRDGRSAGTSHPARSRCRGESGDRRGDSAHAVGQVPVRGVARGGRLHPRRPESPETGGRGGVFVRLLEHAPAGWDERLAFPTP